MQTDQTYQHPVAKHLLTAKGNTKATYDMFIKWKPGAGRRFPEFTERGDRYEKNDVTKMLLYLVRYYIKNYHLWDLALIRDNRIPPGDVEHHVFKHVRKGDEMIIEINRLHEFPFIAESIAIPNWLKNKK